MLSTDNVDFNAFLAKYDTAGNLLWVQQAASNTLISGRGIAVDASGNSYITGSYSSTATFGEITLTSVGQTDVFIAKYDPDGNLEWAQTDGGTGSDVGNGITVDGLGNIFVTGQFRETVVLGESSFTSNGGGDTFVAKYNASGILEWAHASGGSSYSDGGFGIVADGEGNAYVTGQFAGTVTFGSFELNSGYSNDAFVVKFDATGNVQWAQRGGGASGAGFGIATDGAGNIWVVGYYSGENAFKSLSSGGRTEVFTTKYDAVGNVLWARGSGGTSSYPTNGVAVNSAGIAAVTGSFQGAGSFDNTELQTNGNEIFFVTYDPTGNMQWVQKSKGYAASDRSNKITVDNLGNTFVTGYFHGKTSFGSTTLTSNGGADIFIAKYNSAGDVQWAQSIGGTYNDLSYDIAVDRSGNAYVTGRYRGTVSFGKTTLSSGNNYDAFIAKFDGSGNEQWVQRAQGSFYDVGAIAVDDHSNAFVTGTFTRTATFGNMVLTNEQGWEMFIAKYDTQGNFEWAQKSGGSGSVFSLGIAIDEPGSTYATGYFSGTVSFGNSTFASVGYQDAFIVNYGASGDFKWAQRAGGTGYTQGRSIAVDGSGNSFVTGNFEGAANFGSVDLSSNGTYDAFTAKFDEGGNVQWAQSIGGEGYNIGNDVAVDAVGDVYVIGNFERAANFGSSSLTSEGGSNDIFVAKYDASGKEQWAQKAGGTFYDSGNGIALDASGNTYVTGTFIGAANFGNILLTSTGTETFVVKIGNAATTTAIAESKLNASLMLYPNPANDKLHINVPVQTGNAVEVRLLDTNGKVLLKQNYSGAKGELLQTLDLKGKASGVYLLQVITDYEVITRRIVKE